LNPPAVQERDSRHLANSLGRSAAVPGSEVWPGQRMFLAPPILGRERARSIRCRTGIAIRPEKAQTATSAWTETVYFFTSLLPPRSPEAKLLLVRQPICSDADEKLVYGRARLGGGGAWMCRENGQLRGGLARRYLDRFCSGAFSLAIAPGRFGGRPGSDPCHLLPFSLAQEREVHWLRYKGRFGWARKFALRS